MADPRPPRPPIRSPRPSEGNGGITTPWLALISALVLLVIGFVLLAYNMLQLALLTLGVAMLATVIGLMIHRRAQTKP